MRRKAKSGKQDEPEERAADALASAAEETPEDVAAEEPGDDPSDLREQMTRLEEEVAIFRLEAREAGDRALRTLAEFDNFRKRAEKGRRDAEARASAEVLAELLEVADNFDRALEQADEEVPASFVEGMGLIARGLHDLLERRGVTPIEAIGEAFDPEVHDALGSEPNGDCAPNTVVREVQRGYRIGDRVLRPTKVFVARAPDPES